MIPFSLGELAALAGASLESTDTSGNKKPAEIVIKEVSTSSREIGSDCLFIPLKGERFDAHDFIADALEHGAVAFGCSRSGAQDPLTCDSKVKKALAAQGTTGNSVPAVVRCTDTLRLLGLCGLLVRNKCHARIGAITGSCGKTTAKEMMAAILGQAGNTLFTQGNFNNDVGVPLTLLNLSSEHDFAVVEQGASHLEDIARTAEFVQADNALITNVGEAHIAGFGSRHGVYRGKSEILDALFARFDAPEPVVGSSAVKGIGVIPADSEWLPEWRKDYASRFASGQLLTFGESEDATMQVGNITSVDGTLTFHLHCRDERFPLDTDICLNTLGRHNAINAAGAALLALTLGASAEQVKNGLSSAQNMKGRLHPVTYGCGLTVIDDAYNASFNAVIAAIDTLSGFKGKRVFIFGDMGELGDEELELHRKVGLHAQGKIDLFLGIGPLAQYSSQAMGAGACHFSNHESLINYLNALVNEKVKHHPDEPLICLVKGSHAMHMDKIVTALNELGIGLSPERAR